MSIAPFKKRRYDLFSLYDDGVRLNEEMWYSVTPEAIAAHVASRVAGEGEKLILDAFCGAGGNSIQFAMAGLQVVAVDIKQEHIDLAIHNAKIYEMNEFIDCICADFFDIVHMRRLMANVDCVFLSPPWGGIGVSSKSEGFSLLDPGTIFPKLFDIALTRFHRIVVFLPRNIIRAEIEEMARSDPRRRRIEIESHRLVNSRSGYVKACTLYIGFE